MMERAREKVVERAREKVMEKVREKVVERAREKVMEKVREKVMEKMVGRRLVVISVLCHGEGDRFHHRRQQIGPDNGWVPYSHDVLVE